MTMVADNSPKAGSLQYFPLGSRCPAALLPSAKGGAFPLTTLKGRQFLMVYLKSVAESAVQTTIQALTTQFDAFQRMGIAFVVITASQTEAFQAFVASHPTPFPLLCDPTFAFGRRTGIITWQDLKSQVVHQVQPMAYAFDGSSTLVGKMKLADVVTELNWIAAHPNALFPFFQTQQNALSAPQHAPVLQVPFLFEPAMADAIAKKTRDLSEWFGAMDLRIYERLLPKMEQAFQLSFNHRAPYEHIEINPEHYHLPIPKVLKDQRGIWCVRIFLNDAKESGMRFPEHSQLNYVAQKGMAVIFPANLLILEPKPTHAFEMIQTFLTMENMAKANLTAKQQAGPSNWQFNEDDDLRL